MSLSVNLSFVSAQATGLAIYSLNLVERLQDLNPHLLKPGRGYTHEFGLQGHLRRLWWVQWHLPCLLGSSLLFSPIPEAPLWRGCRYVVTVHDLIPLRLPQYFAASQVLYCRHYVRWVLHQAQHILCNSQATAADVRDFLGIRGVPMTVTPLGFDQRLFQPLHLPMGNYFLYVGRSNPHKNLGRVIQAMAGLPEDCQLWVAGSGDDRYTPFLHHLIVDLGLEGRIKFLGYVARADLPVLLNQAIALVFPSLWEGFGLPVLEAMACGTPVITSCVAALAELGKNAAILVNPYSVEELRSAMAELINSSGLRSRLCRLGLERAKQYSWENTAQITRSVLLKYL